MQQYVWGAVLAMAVGAAGTMLAGASQEPAVTPSRDTLTLRVIVVASQADAERVIAQLEQGAAFAALAASVSQDPSRSRGGLLGRTPLSSLRQELREALKGVSVGQITRPVRIPTGYAVLKVDADAADETSPPGAGSPAVAAVGAVKYVFDVSGFNDATVIMQRHQKPEGWNLDPSTICRVRTASLMEAQANLRANLASPELLARGQPMDLAQAHFTRAQLFAYEGRMAEAIEALSEALLIATARVPAMRLHMEEALGIAHLHRAHHDGGVCHEPGARCLLTLASSPAFWSIRRRRRRRLITSAAISARSRTSSRCAGCSTSRTWSRARYPARVPPAHLHPARRVRVGGRRRPLRRRRAADRAARRSRRPAASSSTTSTTTAGSTCVTSSIGQLRADAACSGATADGLFVEQVGDGGPRRSAGRAEHAADRLRQRRLPRHAGAARRLGSCRSASRCCATTATARFTDVTVASGLAGRRRARRRPSGPTSTTTGCSICSSATRAGPAQLFRNQGDGTFEDVARAAGVDRTAFTKGVAAGRLRQRRLARPVRLEPRRHATSCIATTATARSPRWRRAPACPGPGTGFATWFFDYDNDGWLDLFVDQLLHVGRRDRAHVSGAAAQRQHAEAVSQPAATARFQDVTRAGGLDKVFMPMGANFGDIDNDGFLDIYLGTGNPSYGVAGAERAAAQPGRAVVRRRHRVVGHRRTAQGPRRGVRRPGQRRRRGDRVRGRRRHAGRRARAAAVREPRARQRLARR